MDGIGLNGCLAPKCIEANNDRFVYIYFTGAIAHAAAYFGPGEGPIVLDNVHCSGTEKFLLSCVSSPVYSHNCHHSEDAGVSCQS